MRRLALALALTLSACASAPVVDLGGSKHPESYAKDLAECESLAEQAGGTDPWMGAVLGAVIGAGLGWACGFGLRGRRLAATLLTKSRLCGVEMNLYNVIQSPSKVNSTTYAVIEGGTTPAGYPTGRYTVILDGLTLNEADHLRNTLNYNPSNAIEFVRQAAHYVDLLPSGRLELFQHGIRLRLRRDFGVNRVSRDYTFDWQFIQHAPPLFFYVWKVVREFDDECKLYTDMLNGPTRT